MNHIATALPVSAEPEAGDAAGRWLDRFNTALAAVDRTGLAALFAEECHLRDLLAFTWGFKQAVGVPAVVDMLAGAQPAIGATGFAVAPGRTPPRRVSRTGVEVFEAIVQFETKLGRGHGVLRLPVADPSRAWVLHTTLEELKGHEERIGPRRPSGSAYSRNFGGENWLDQRIRARAFADRDPVVLVVGGGQSGLSIAARLNQLGVDTLVVEKNARLGDNWRVRYHSLALHNQIDVNDLPYVPFPPTWPRYIPKDMLADWLEMYAGMMEVNCWTGTEFGAGSTWDPVTKTWTVRLTRADGTERVMHPSHIVLANGTNGIPRIPDLPGLAQFAGKVFHSHGFRNGDGWRGRKALVVGTGNSGHDVAQDLYSHGVHTTIIQRGPTTVVSIEPSARLNFALYEEGLPVDDCDLIATASTYPLMVRGYQLGMQRMLELDRELIEGLKARGFKYDIGHDETGHQMKYFRRTGGYYLDAGCAGLIIDGEIGLLQWDDIERFVPTGALLKDGSVQEADLIVLATGYYPPQEVTRRLLGDAVADRIGPVWGFDGDGELANMWKRTAQEGLWFMGGGLPHCRLYSRHLALQIKAVELGLIPGAVPA